MGILTGTLGRRVLLCAALALPAAAAGRVIDDTGREVVMTAPAERIVTLAPHATELAVAAGATGRLVAIAAGSPPPPELAGLPRIGGAGPLDRETLLAVEPDLVIGWQSGNRAADLDWITERGIAVYRSEPRDLADVARSIRVIGQLADTGATAAVAAQDFLDASRTACSDLPARPALVLVWTQPPMTVGGRHWINPVLQAAGFRNHFAAVPVGTFQVGREALLGAGRAHRVSLVPGASDDPLLVDLLSRPGPRLAAAVQRLCQRRLELVPESH